MEALTVRVPFGEVSDLGYDAILRLQERFEEQATTFGSARMLLSTVAGAEIMRFEGADWQLHIIAGTGSVDGGEIVGDLSWLALKAYLYALWTGCREQIRLATEVDGRRRFVPIGTDASAYAEVGGWLINVSALVGLIPTDPDLRIVE